MRHSLVDFPASAARGELCMTVQDFVDMVREVRSDFAREKDQGLLRDDMKQAQHALAGEHACDRILRKIEARSGVHVVPAPNRGRAR